MIAALQRFGARFDDLVNPIVVKELRQAVRSKAVLGVLSVMLVVLLVIVIFVSLAATADEVTARGAEMFMIFNGIVLALAALFTPIYSAARMAGERKGAAADLLYTTTISPVSVVWGKLATAMLVAMLFLCASLPFLTLAYLYRGIDLPTIAFYIGWDMLIVLGTVTLGVFIAVLPISSLVRVLAGLIAVPMLLWRLIGMISGLLLFDGVVGSVTQFDSEEWTAVGVGAGLLLVITGLFFVLSVAQVMPDVVNRGPIVRIYLTVVWAITGGVAYYFADDYGDGETMFVWMYPWIILLALATAIATGGRREYRARMQRTVPRRLPLRALFFLFSSGAASGMLWATLLGLATLGVGYLAIVDVDPSVLGRNMWSDYVFERLTPIPIGVLAFAMIAVVFRDKILNGRLSRWTTPGFTILIAGLGNVLPVVLLLLISPDTWERQDWVFHFTPLGSLFADDSVAFVPRALFFNGTLVLLFGAVLAGWAKSQWSGFKRLESEEPTGGELSAGFSAEPDPVMDNEEVGDADGAARD